MTFSQTTLNSMSGRLRHFSGAMIEGVFGCDGCAAVRARDFGFL